MMLGPEDVPVYATAAVASLVVEWCSASLVFDTLALASFAVCLVALASTLRAPLEVQP